MSKTKVKEAEDRLTNSQTRHGKALHGMYAGCATRMTALELKGKKRDEAVLHYCCGYAKALQDFELANLVHVIVLGISIRGYSWIEEHLAQE